MTFSIIGHCPQTGAFGGAVTTSDLAVGNRCLHLAHGRGAVLSQHRTDPRLGALGLRLLLEGLSAQQVVAEIAAATPDIHWRQIGVLDAAGGSAAYHGASLYSIHTDSAGRDCLALGNILDNDRVTDAMARAFGAAATLPLAERLMRGLEAGQAAGGEIFGPLQSAALQVTGPDDIAQVDLRIDISAGCALADLRALHDAYQPRAAGLRRVALAPDEVPVNAALFEASLDRIDALGLADRFPSRRNRDRWRIGS
ncbi:DUF1028 domain-containing protein [Pseudooceanicola nanhaiensis]|uniref:DUF1028 domain-containing protein n=1 Tax=Pseudooceanicola nanhaiensis TaxID=375761 RepID=UPI001CD5C51C|nr:DUF1028 domain-containing protein [Pseudooceanicola nanhaiensis]MCA0920485.1 DUF1028 domain-containing protein [Pseudooceanicola nanhaiensis]